MALWVAIFLLALWGFCLWQCWSGFRSGVVQGRVAKYKRRQDGIFFWGLLITYLFGSLIIPTVSGALIYEVGIR